MRWSKLRHFFKKYRTLLIVLLVGLLFGTTITLLSINWNNLKIIYAAGSSAVAPLMESLNPNSSSNNSSNEFKENVDLNIAATGSGNGIEVAVNGTKHLGNVSRSPKIDEAGYPNIGDGASSGKYSKQWNEKKLKTITLGWDAISVVYKPKNKDFDLDINSNNIASLYEVFSGVKQLSFSDLSNDSNQIDNTILRPYSRTGGALKSGTTEAFLRDSNLNYDKDKIRDSISILENGSYKSNVITTKESNIETWVQARNGGYGSIIYLSGGFVLSNINEIHKYGFKIATYDKITLTDENITNGYNWYRPFNTITSIDVDSYVKYWIEWVIDPNNIYVDNVFKKIGIIRLNNNQLSSMCIKSSFWVSDYQLIMETKKVHYGAMPK